MKYTYENIDKIVEFKTWTIKQKLDELFRIDCDMYTNLGIESTKKERDEVKRMSKQIYKAISKIDSNIGNCKRGKENSQTRKRKCF